jgi:translation initiation factor SUI1
MSNIDNFGVVSNEFIFDDFKQTIGGADIFNPQTTKIHIRFQKTGPRSITLIEGLDDDLDHKRIAKYMKKAFKCSSSIHIDKDGQYIIQLQGDQRANVFKALTEMNITKKEYIKVHG